MIEEVISEGQPIADDALSTSVKTAIRRLPQGRPLQAWEIVRALLSVHPEYGGGIANTVHTGPGPTKGELKDLNQWLMEVRASLNPSVTHIHGRLLIVALSHLEPHLHQYLTGAGLLQAIESEIRQPSELRFRDMGSPSDADNAPDIAVLHIDNPAMRDLLGRAAFARALAVRLDRLWNECANTPVHGSFILHLHGPWGSGKTSLLNLLRQALQPRAARAQPANSSSHSPVATTVSRWIVVDFNAWQHERLRTPWWSLMDAVYRQGRSQLNSLFRERWRGLCLGMFERLWRLCTLRSDDVMKVGIVALIGSVGYLAISNLFHFEGWPSAASSFSDILAVAATLISAGLVVSRSLLSGSATSAADFIRTGVDPMHRITRHFRRMVGVIRHPIVIFIDDLDRCQPRYVIELLEGIQTLFYDPRLTYVIAADRRWLDACYATTYEAFTSSVHDTGRPLGSLFLEKVFELSVSLPPLSPDRQRAYWHDLLRGAALSASESSSEIDTAARSEFADASTESEVLGRLHHVSPDPQQQHARRAAAVERLATARVEHTTEHFLEVFAPLLEPNPRAMKRLLNAYAVARDFAILSGNDVLFDVTMRKKLVLWTILCMRWPTIESHFVALASGTREEEARQEMRALAATTHVQRVYKGEGIGTQLDFPAIRIFAGLSNLVPA